MRQCLLSAGLYEQVINNRLDSELSEVSEARQSTAPIDKAEASKVLAQYLTEVVQQGLQRCSHGAHRPRCGGEAFEAP